MGNLGTIIVKTGFKKLPKLQLIAQSGHFDGEPDGIEGQQQEQQQQQNSSNTFFNQATLTRSLAKLRRIQQFRTSKHKIV